MYSMLHISCRPRLHGHWWSCAGLVLAETREAVSWGLSVRVFPIHSRRPAAMQLGPMGSHQPSRSCNGRVAMAGRVEVKNLSHNGLRRVSEVQRLTFCAYLKDHNCRSGLSDHHHQQLGKPSFAVRMLVANRSRLAAQKSGVAAGGAVSAGCITAAALVPPSKRTETTGSDHASCCTQRRSGGALHSPPPAAPPRPESP